MKELTKLKKCLKECGNWGCEHGNCWKTISSDIFKIIYDDPDEAKVNGCSCQFCSLVDICLQLKILYLENKELKAKICNEKLNKK